MEPITLCGLVIVMFVLWVELEPAVKEVVTMIRKSRLFTRIFSSSTNRKPVYAGKMPLCVNRISNLT